MSVYSTPAYKCSPIPLQNLVVSLKGLASLTAKRRPTFWAQYRQIKEREKFNHEKIKNWQDVQLRTLISHAFKYVPYYRELSKKYHLLESDFQSADDVRKLPYLEKDTVRSNPLAFVARNLRNRLLVRASTAGSTGTPLSLYRTLPSIAQEHAYIWRQFSWAGCNPGDKICTLRGDMVVPASQHSPPFWRYDIAQSSLHMSSYHLSEETIPSYLSALRRYQPALIYAYPSAVNLLAHYIVTNGIDLGLPSLRSVVTSSETLLPSQRELIAKAMGCRVFDWYGLGERVAFIGTCEHGSYHLFDDYGITEFHPVGQNKYELVATGFTNLGMPLIRYRTGDLVRLGEHNRCGCNRVFTVVGSIDGRSDDIVRLKSGRMIGRLDLIFKGLKGIVEAQVVQRTLEDVLIKVVVDRSFRAETMEKLKYNARERFGEELRVETQIVPRIERNAAGKFRSVVSLQDD